MTRPVAFASTFNATDPVTSMSLFMSMWPVKRMAPQSLFLYGQIVGDLVSFRTLH
jgi:hypothetical protein